MLPYLHTLQGRAVGRRSRSREVIKHCADGGMPLIHPWINQLAAVGRFFLLVDLSSGFLNFALLYSPTRAGGCVGLSSPPPHHVVCVRDSIVVNPDDRDVPLTTTSAACPWLHVDVTKPCRALGFTVHGSRMRGNASPLLCLTHAIHVAAVRALPAPPPSCMAV